MPNSPIDVSSDTSIIALIDELKHQLKVQGEPSRLRADLSGALSKIIKRHNLDSDSHNYAVLPPGWVPKPFWYYWWPARVWRWLTSFYWIYGPRCIPWWKESQHPAPTFTIKQAGGDLLQYNIPISKIIEDNTINDLQEPPRRYLRFLLSCPWHPARVTEHDVLDWGLYSQGGQPPFQDECVSNTVTFTISEEHYQCLHSLTKPPKNT
jgi:hypothetical protein